MSPKAVTHPHCRAIAFEHLLIAREYCHARTYRGLSKIDWRDVAFLKVAYGAGNSFFRRDRKSLRVVIGADSDRRRHARTIEEASALVPVANWTSTQLAPHRPCPCNLESSRLADPPASSPNPVETTSLSAASPRHRLPTFCLLEGIDRRSSGIGILSWLPYSSNAELEAPLKRFSNAARAAFLSPPNR